METWQQIVGLRAAAEAHLGQIRGARRVEAERIVAAAAAFVDPREKAAQAKILARHADVVRRNARDLAALANRPDADGAANALLSRVAPSAAPELLHPRLAALKADTQGRAPTENGNA